MAIINGTKGTHGTNGASPTAGGKGSNEAFTQNGKIGADSITQQVFGGEGGDGGNNSNPLALGGMGGAGGNATITFNGNIFNAPATNTLLVTLTATGGNGGAGGTGTPAGAQGVGGNGTVTMSGNIVQPNKVMGAIELDAIAVGGNGSRKGNASATVNGNIIQPGKGATSVTLKAIASNTFDSFTHDGDLAYGIKTATLNGNIVQGNINNVYLQATATPSNGTATVNGNIVQVNTNTVAATTVTLDVSGNHIAVTNNKIILGKQEFDFTINEYAPYDASISGNEFKGSGTNAFVFTDNAIPGPHHDTVSINLGTGTFVFNGQSNILTGFSSVTVAGNGVNASLTGGPGDDTLIGGDGDDIIDGGGGNDVIYGGKGNDILTGGQGNDILHGNDGDDVLDGGAGNDQLFGGAGDDVLIVSTGTDLLDGMTDPLGDTVDFRNASSGVTANLGGAQQNFTTSYGGITTLTTLLNIQNINGSAFGDTLTGDGVANTLSGGGGNDRLIGAGGNDTLNGDGGSDTAVYGGNFAQYTVAVGITGNGTVADNRLGTSDGTDTLSSIEFIEFADGTYNTATSTFTPTGPVNTPPVANNDAFATNEDTALVIGPVAGVLANDTDAELNPLTAAVVTGPAHGALTLNANGSFTYTPTANYHGADSFTYKANDGTSDSNIATVNITVNSVNDAPVAAADSYATNEDTVLTVPATGVLANDSDVDGDPLTSILVSGPAHGGLTLNANGSFTYTPNANYNGADSFTYKANDGLSDSNIATVNITVNSVNDAPVAVADSYATNEDTVLTVPATGVLANDSDVDGDPLASILVSGPAHGGLTLNANGSFTYTPNANYNGADSFTYKANDGLADSNVATVNITVNSVADAPVAVGDSYAVNEDAVLTVPATGVLANDSDGDGDPLTSILVSGPAHGVLTLNPNGSFTYTPNANYFGADSFTYKANDGLLDSGNATVSITVNPVNDAPVAVADSYATDFNTALIVTASGVLGNDTDIDGDPLHVSAVTTGPAHGSLTLNANGSFTYTPDNGYVGADSFSYKANDGTMDSNIATVSLTVNGGQTYPGTPGNDTLTGTNFDDVFYVTTGTDTIDGGPNGPLGDTVVFTNASSGVNANLGPAQQTFTSSFGGTPTLTTLSNIENLTGSNFDDTLTGNVGNNTVSGGIGDDILVASAGTDVLDGGANTAFGDTADFRDATSGVNVNLGGAQQDFTANGLGLVTLTNIENLTGSSHDDLLTGNAGANRLDGGAGTDKVLYATQPVASDIGWNGTAFTVSNFGGTDTLVNVEQVDDAAQAGAKVLLVGAGGYATINAAIAAANAGDTILIAPGTYNENVIVNKDGLTLQGVGPGVSIRGTFDTENAAHGFNPGDSVSTFLETHGYDVVGVGDGITVSANNVTLSNLTSEYFNNAVATTGAISGLTLDGVTMQHSVMGFAKPDGSETTGLTITGSTVSDTYIGVYLYNDNFALDATSQAIDTTITNTLFQNIAQKGIYAETAQGNTLLDGLTLDNVGEYGGGPGFGSQGLNGNGIQFNLKFHTYVGNLDISNFTLTNVGSSDGLGTPHAGGGAIVVEGRDDPGHPTYGVHPADVSGLIVNVSNGSIDGTSVGIRAGEANKANPSLNVSGPNVTVTNVTITNASQGEIDNHTQSGLMTVEGTNGDDVYRSNQTLVSAGALLLNGYGGNDTLTGGAGNDILDGGTGDDILDGGLGGTDTALYTDATQNGLTVNLSSGTSSGGGLGNDTLYNITNVFGSAFNDTLVGDYNDNLLAGNDSNDILYGHGGTNLLVGGDGTDVAYYAGLETDYVGPTTSAVTGGAESVDDTLSSIERLKFLSPTHVSDVDNNGKGDQITQETTTGNLTINQQLVGTINVSGVLLGGAVWKAVGTGQFDPDADRTSDILLQNSSTGDLEVLTDLAGTPTVTALSAQPGSANWKAVATGDFNGDAASDILLQNSVTGATEIMFLNTNAGDGFLVLPDAPGTVAATTSVTGPAAGTAWKAIATGDFNADGKSDIVWQNSTTKQVQVYLMDGATRLNTPVSQAASGLTAIGTGDFNGDGNSDILFQNASGQAVIWFMNGAVHTGNKTIAKPTAAAWSVSGAEDVDGNGYSDIIWTDASGNAAATKLGGPSSLTSTTVMNSNFGLTPAAGGFHFIASTGGG